MKRKKRSAYPCYSPFWQGFSFGEVCESPPDTLFCGIFPAAFLFVPMIHRYTVFGNPIEHSKSPEIHRLFSDQTQRMIVYTRTLATPETFESDVTRFFADGGDGCNVTVPFKEQAASICDRLDQSAERACAVNTIRPDEGGGLTGFNTDGSGLVADLGRNKRLKLAGMRILIAGAGGATRGILGPLLDQEPAELLLANRTLDKAVDLANAFSETGNISACRYEDLPSGSFGLVINATSMSLGGDRPPLPDTAIGPDTVAYDLSYGKDSPFMQWAASGRAAAVYDGMGMLIEQAADAFYHWERVRPKTRLIVARL